MLFIVVVTCFLCCGNGMSQPTHNETVEMCLSATYFDNNCIATTSETSTTMSHFDFTTNYSTTDFPSNVTTNEATTTIDTRDISKCCYGRMCIDNSFIDNCTHCNNLCKHGCSLNDSDKCLCFSKEDKDCQYYDEDSCKCVKGKPGFLEKNLIAFIFIVIVGCLVIIIIVSCLVYRCCCHDRQPPEPVAKPTDIEPTEAEQPADFGDIYGNVDESGQMRTESAPGDLAVSTHHGTVNEKHQDSTRLLPQQRDYGDIYENVAFHNQGGNSASFENEATSLRLLKTKSKTKSSKDPYLPKQLSIPESNPPPPPPSQDTGSLGKMLMQQLATLPGPRQIDDADIHGVVTPVSSRKHTKDYGDMYETPNVTQPDYGGDYEVPTPAGNQLVGNSTDYGDDYEIVIKDNSSPTRVPDQDFDNTYEPVSVSNHPDTHTKKRKAQELPPVHHSDYGGEYGNVNVDRDVNVIKKLSEKFQNPNSPRKVCPPPPVQKKKPQVSKKPQGKSAKKLENKPQDYGDTYEAPMAQGIACQPDYGGDYEAPMVQNIAKEKDFGGDYEAPMVQNIARGQDFGGDYEAPMGQNIAGGQDFGEDYEAPMIQKFAREQDFGGDYEAPMSQQNPDDPDFGSIYENTMVGSLQKPTATEAENPPVEDCNQVYDQPYTYNQPLKFKGMRGDYYNQPAPKADPAINKENYTKLYRT